MSETIEGIPRVPALGRRDLMKLGAGVVTAALSGTTTGAQGRGGQGGSPAPGSMPDPATPRMHVGPGYKNTANRLGGNGPMDDTTRQIVTFVTEFNRN